jgi:hypothetical protein
VGAEVARPLSVSSGEPVDRFAANEAQQGLVAGAGYAFTGVDTVREM